MLINCTFPQLVLLVVACAIEALLLAVVAAVSLPRAQCQPFSSEENATRLQTVVVAMAVPATDSRTIKVEASSLAHGLGSKKKSCVVLWFGMEELKW